MAEEKKPIPTIKSFSPDKGGPGTTVTIDGEFLDNVTKVKVLNKWAEFTKDRGKIKVKIPDIGHKFLSITLVSAYGSTNNRACGVPNFLNMAGESIEVAPSA